MIVSEKHLLSFFSSDSIDSDIARVKDAAIGEEIFRCSIWSCTDYVDTILYLSGVQFHELVNNDLGIVRYIKGRPATL